MSSDRTEWEQILAGDPSVPAWDALRPLLETSDPQTLAAAASRIREWPARFRPMPDQWWEDRLAGQTRPWHALAAWRRLGDLDDVESCTATGPVDDDEDEDEDEGSAYFYHGATSVACTPDLAWLVLCAAAEWHHNGGDIVLWGAGRDVPGRMLLNGSDFHDEAWDAQLSPDGSTAVASVEGRLHAWSVPDGRERWRVELGPADGEDGDFETEDTIPRIGFSGDGRRIALASVAGGVRVVDAATGEVILAVGGESFDPVALDLTGQRVAHGAPLGEVVLRDVGSGAVLSKYDTGLVKVNALAFAPDGGRLLVAGAGVGGSGALTAGTGEAVPAAVLLTVVDGQTERAADIRRVQPTGQPPKMSAESPYAAMGTRAVWGEHGPLVFATDDRGAALFDGSGRVLWTESDAVVGNFSADGRILTVVGETVTAVFLDALFDSETAAADSETVPAGPLSGRSLESLLSGPPSEAVWAEVCSLAEGLSADEVSALLPLAHAWPPQVRGMPDPWWRRRRAGVHEPWHALAGTRVLCTDLELPGGEGRRIPCSYGRVMAAAASPALDLVAFAATVDRRADGPQFVVCRWDGDGRQHATIITDPRPQDPRWDTDLLLSPDSTMLVSAAGSERGTVTAYSVADGQPLWRFPFDAGLHGRGDWVRIGFSGDGLRLAAASHSRGRVVVLDSRTGEVVNEMPERAKFAKQFDRMRADAVALDTTGRRVAYGAADERSRIVVRDVASGERLLQAEPDGLRQVMGLAFAPDDSAVAVAGMVGGEFTPDRPCVWMLDRDGGVVCRTTAPGSGKPGLPSDMRTFGQPHGDVGWTAAGGWALFRGQSDTSILLDIHEGTKLGTIPYGVLDAGAAPAVGAGALITATKHGVLAWLIPHSPT